VSPSTKIRARAFVHEGGQEATLGCYADFHELEQFLEDGIKLIVKVTVFLKVGDLVQVVQNV
jgi:hypothetical protein